MPENIERTREIVQEVLKTDQAELRMEKAARLCGDDRDLLELVRRHLIETVDANDRGSSDGSLERGIDLPVGAVLGAYRVVRFLGRGGMGSVFAATRVDQPEWKVALKVVRSRDPDLIARLDRERRVMARLNHPNIARVLDTGFTEDGLPWLALEHIEGMPLDVWCNRHRLSIPKRLALFEVICEAVSFAHRHLVIHRDLKPANILVDEHGCPKLLDFGIAAPLDAETGRHKEHAEGSSMTPRYASPEQLRGEPLTAATDVYSLGVIFYELLCGHTPYLLTTRSPAAIGAWIDCHPPRDFLPLGQDEAQTRIGIAAIASERGTRPSRLELELRGDLQRIARRALAARIEDRYGSVDALLEDLHRYRQNLPISVGPKHSFYRMGKFVRRNRSLVSAGCALLLILIAFSASLWHQNELLARERDQIREEKNATAKVTSFLQDMFEVPESELQPSEEMTVPEILARARQKLAEELTDQPEIRGRLLNTLGTVYAKQGQFEDATELLEEAVAVLMAGEEVAVSAKVAALFDLLEHQLELSLLDEAEHTMVRLDSLAEDIDSPIGRGKLEYSRGNLLRARGKDREAGRVYEAALETLREKKADAGNLEMGLLNGAATVYQNLGHLERASELFEEAIRVAEANDASRDNLTTLRSNLGLLLGMRGHFEEAEVLIRETLVTYRELEGEEGLQVARTLNNLGWLMMQSRRYQPSIAHFRQALEIQKENLPAHHQAIAQTTNNLAVALGETGDFEEAERHLRDSLATTRSAVGERHPAILRLRNNLGDLMRRKGDLETAEHLFLEAIALSRELGRANHPSHATMLNNLAWVVDWIEPARAVALEREALEITGRFLTDPHPKLARYQHNLAVYLMRAGDLEEAEQYALKASSHAAEIFGEEHSVHGGYLLTLGQIVHGLKRFEEASSYLDQAEAILGRNEGEPLLLHLREARAALMISRERVDPACALLEENLTDMGKTFGVRHPYVLRARVKLGVCLATAGHLEEAADHLETAHASMSAQFGDASHQTLGVVRELIRLHERRRDTARVEHYRGLLPDTEGEGALEPASADRSRNRFRR